MFLRLAALMVIDTSALLAVLLDAQERRAFNELIEQARITGQKLLHKGQGFQQTDLPAVKS